MATEVKRRRGTTAQHSTFTGAEGEITVDLTKDTLVVHNGSTQAGFPLLREDFSNIPSSVSFTSDLTVAGNLTVTGTTTFINSQHLNIGDAIITLNADITSTTNPTENAGIEVKRGTGATKSFIWNESNDRWQADDALYVSGSLTSTGNISGGIITGSSIVKSGGASSEFLKADGSVESGSAALTSLGIGNVENIALSTYTGQGGALDNQYITNGAGYTNNVGTITGVTGGTGLTGAGTSGAVTLNVSGLTTTQFSAATLLDSTEGFVSSNAMIMTSSAVASYIASFNYTSNVGTITGVTGGAGLDGGGTSGTVTLSHSDTSSQSSVDNSGVSVIQDVTLDTYGHVTGLTSKDLVDEFVPDKANLVVQSAAQGNGSLSYNQTNKQFEYTPPASAAGDITEIATSTTSGLSGGTTSGVATLSLNISRLVDMTEDVAAIDEIAILDGTTNKRKPLGEIDISVFNNDAGFGAGDITGVTAGAGLSGGGTSGAVTLSHSDTSSQASVDNSNGSVIQDVTLDTYGHVTGLTSTDLDSRYLELSGGTLTGSLTVQSVTAISTSAPKFQLKESDTTDENKEILLSGGDFFIRNLNDDGTVPSNENILKISHEGVVTLMAQGTTTAENLNALFQDGNGVLKRRTLGSNAFNSTTIPTNNNQLTNGAGYTTNVGDITGVTAGNGLSGGGTSGAVTLAVDFSELPSNPPVAIDSTDQLIWYETGSGTENRTVISSFPLSAFDNDSSFINQTNGDARYLRSNADDTTTGNITIGKADPVLILNDTSASNSTVLTAFTSYRAQGSEKGFVGYGSGSNNYLYVRNSDGRIDIQGSTGIYLNSDTTLSGDLDVTGGDLTLGTDSIASNINAVGDVLAFKVDSNENSGGTPNMQFKVGAATKLTINESTATFAGNVSMASGNSVGKFAVLSSGVHPSYDLYNNGTSYFNGGVTVDAGFTQSGGAVSSFSGAVNIAGNVHIGDAVQVNSYGAFQVNQTSNVDEEGIAILSASAGRSMRLYVDETNSYINSGNGGNGDLILNEGTGSVGIGTASPVNNTPLTLQAPSGYTDTLWLKSVGTNIASRINIGPTGTGNAQINNATGTNIEFQVSGSEKMRITSGGDVEIGTITNAATRILTIDSSTVSKINLDVGSEGTVGNFEARSGEVSIGANTAADLHLKTSGTDQVTVDYIGNVGIGETSPSAKLDIKGDGADFFLRSNDFKIARIQPRGTGADLDKGLLSLFDGSTEDVRIDTQGSSWFNGGNVGIGTTSPTSKVSITDSATMYAAVDGILLDVKRNASNGGETTGRVGLRLANNSNGFNIYYGGTTDRLRFVDGGNTEVLSLKNGGNVGIGATNPAQKLVVNGGIHAYGNITTPASGTHGLLMDYYIADSRFWSRGTTGGGTRGGFKFYQLEADGTNQITSFALDTSGNASFNYDLQVDGDVLVGKTSSGIATVGVELKSDGNLVATRQGVVASLNREDSDGDVLDIRKDTTTVGTLGNAGADLFINSSGSKLLFKVAGTTEMRLNANYLLVSTANENVYNGTTTGTAIGNGYIFSGRSGDAPLYLNRISNDGNIIRMNRDGAAVGAIGVEDSNNLFIQALATNGTGLTFPDNNVVPRKNGSNSDNGVDLGHPSVRWKNFYLGGDANIDGDAFIDGNVGIGTTSPSAVDTNNGTPKLQVETDASLGNHPLVARFTVDADAGDNSGASILINSGNDRGLMISAGRAVGNVARSTLNIVTNTGDELTDGIYLGQASTGSSITNVGIGTDSPNYKLEVNGNAEFLDNVNIKSNSYDDYQIAVDSVGFSIYNRTDSAYNMTIDHTGNVGIGTTDPKELLHIYQQGTVSNYYDEGALQIGGPSTSYGALLSYHGSSSGRVSLSSLYNTGGANATLSFGFGGINTSGRPTNEVLTVNQAGNVGIGATSPTSKVSISKDDNTTNDLDVLNLKRVWTSATSTDRSHGIKFSDTNATLANIYADRTNSASNYNGDLVFVTNSGASGTNTSEKMRILSSGGITFNGDTATANALDDYEEGTFTPQIHAGASNPSFNSNNYGKYTKIGNVVHCSGRFSVNSITAGSSSTNVELGGLPFAANTPLGTSTGAIAGSIGFATGFAGEAPTMMQIRDGETNAFLYFQNSSLGISNLKGNDFGTGAHSIVFQITYHV